MKTETSLKTAKNLGLWSFCGLVQSFDLWGKGRPVTVTVKALGHQKTGPDRTFKHYKKSHSHITTGEYRVVWENIDEATRKVFQCFLLYYFA